MALFFLCVVVVVVVVVVCSNFAWCDTLCHPSIHAIQSWYFHAIPLLLWAPMLHQAPSSSWWKWHSVGFLLLLVTVPVMLEVAFLTFPATPASSTLLQVAHVVVLSRIRPLSTHGNQQAVVEVVHQKKTR
jgi:hypothetical protein